MFSLEEDFVIITVGKAANKGAFIFKHFYVVPIIKEVNFDCHLSDQDDNKTYEFMNNKTEDQIF